MREYVGGFKGAWAALSEHLAILRDLFKVWDLGTWPFARRPEPDITWES